MKLTQKEIDAVWKYHAGGMVPGQIAKKLQCHVNTVKSIVDPDYIAAIRERNKRLVNKPGRKFKKPPEVRMPAIQTDAKAKVEPAVKPIEKGISKSGIPYVTIRREIRYGDGGIRQMRISLPRLTFLEADDV